MTYSIETNLLFITEFGRFLKFISRKVKKTPQGACAVYEK
jgi:hypothetical protein